jgi:hypothetical protein
MDEPRPIDEHVLDELWKKGDMNAFYGEIHRYHRERAEWERRQRYEGSYWTNGAMRARVAGEFLEGAANFVRDTAVPAIVGTAEAVLGKKPSPSKPSLEELDAERQTRSKHLRAFWESVTKQLQQVSPNYDPGPYPWAVLD